MNAALFPDLIVNGELVPHAVVAAETQNHSAPTGKPGIAWRKAARAIAIRTLLLQEAAVRGVAATPANLGQGREETTEEALIRGLLDSEVSVDAPSDDAVQAEWARDPSRFRAPPLWEVSHILIACDMRDEAARNAAETNAHAVLDQVRAKPRAFAAIAESQSDCGSKSNGGVLGQLSPGDTVPEFERALRDMSEGDISEPVPTRHGWHIIRIDGLAIGDVLPFEAVQPRIKDAMEKAGWSRAAREFVDGLVAKAEIQGVDFDGPL